MHLDQFRDDAERPAPDRAASGPAAESPPEMEPGQERSSPRDSISIAPAARSMPTATRMTR